ncbi:MAG: universal stress protein [Sphingomonas sp.]|jgi:nucleotide-binding universal stress UspA family protein|uniref:universal stress protein n=1 Tax=Sphingomonas sp. TaxID=28214 RepID=UPI00356AB725
MTRSILAVLDDVEKSRGFIASVLAQAEYGGADVVFQLLTPDPLLLPQYAPLGALYMLPAERDARAAEQVEQLRAAIGQSPVAVELLGLHDDVAWLVGDLRKARVVTDIAMIGAVESWAVPWLHRRVAETLALGSGTPLVILPPGRTLRHVGHVVLGWKPVAAAVRALHDLVALATPGARIELASVGSGPATLDEARAQERAVRYLAQHGFQAESLWLDQGGDPADRLTVHALDQGADLLAIGAFAHTRLRELILGGVTASLIEDTHLPVMLSH